MTSQVWHLSKVDGTVLCGTDRGLYAVHGASAMQISGVDGTWTVCQLKHHPDYIIACDYMGMVLLRMEGGTPKVVRRLKTTIPSSGNMFEDNDGTLWISIWQHGIYHLRLSADMTRVDVLELFNKRNGLPTDENNLLCQVAGRIYVSAVDGLHTYDPHSHKLTYDKRMSRLFNTYGSPLRIITTPSGDIWAQKSGFIAIAHRGYNSYTVDSVSYRPILENQQTIMGDMSPLSDSQTLINSIDGFFLVANRMRNTDRDYELYLRRITSTNNGDSILYQSLAYNAAPKEIVIPHSLNSIRVEFALPEYRSTKAVTYQCYLENYDTHWSYTDSLKEYTRLARGTYILHVKAYNRLSGKTQEIEMAIRVLPAWYDTTLARIAYIIIIGIGLWLLVRWLKARAERELTKERLRNERQMQEQQTKLEMEKSKRRAQTAEMQAERLQNELKHKSSELASSTMSLIHQNDILQKLDADMQELSESVRRDERKANVTKRISDIRLSLQESMNNDEGWKKFEENFNLVYDDFMTQLTKRFPLLKISDRKLCAYLRMGLSSKDMASLLNMSVRSVETARYRLRKKLNLEQGDNLTDFIQNFNKQQTEQQA